MSWLVISANNLGFSHCADINYIKHKIRNKSLDDYAAAHKNNAIEICHKYGQPKRKAFLQHRSSVPIEVLCEKILASGGTALPPCYTNLILLPGQNARNIMKKYPQIAWRFEHKIPYFTFEELLEEYPNLMKTGTIERMLAQLKGAAQYICGTNLMSERHIEWPQAVWDAISCNPHVDIAYILERKHMPWNWRFVSMRHDMTLAIAREHSVAWDWQTIYKHVPITANDVIQAHKENKIPDLFSIISHNNYLIRHHQSLFGMFAEEKWEWSSTAICRQITLRTLRNNPAICKYVNWRSITSMSCFISAEEMLEVIINNIPSLHFAIDLIIHRSDFDVRLSSKYGNILGNYLRTSIGIYFCYSIETAEQARYFLKLAGRPSTYHTFSWHIDCKIIDELAEEFEWNWNYVAKNPTITPEFIEKYRHKLDEDALLCNKFYYYEDYAIYCKWGDIRRRRGLICEEFGWFNCYVAHYIDWT